MPDTALAAADATEVVVLLRFLGERRLATTATSATRLPDSSRFTRTLPREMPRYDVARLSRLFGYQDGDNNFERPPIADTNGLVM
jgi:hypothetical protein